MKKTINSKKARKKIDSKNLFAQINTNQQEIELTAIRSFYEVHIEKNQTLSKTELNEGVEVLKKFLESPRESQYSQACEVVIRAVHSQAEGFLSLDQGVHLLIDALEQVEGARSPAVSSIVHALGALTPLVLARRPSQVHNKLDLPLCEAIRIRPEVCPLVLHEAFSLDVDWPIHAEIIIPLIQTIFNDNKSGLPNKLILIQEFSSYCWLLDFEDIKQKDTFVTVAKYILARLRLLPTLDVDITLHLFQWLRVVSERWVFELMGDDEDDTGLSQDILSLAGRFVEDFKGHGLSLTPLLQLILQLPSRHYDLALLGRLVLSQGSLQERKCLSSIISRALIDESGYRPYKDNLDLVHHYFQLSSLRLPLVVLSQSGVKDFPEVKSTLLALERRIVQIESLSQFRKALHANKVESIEKRTMETLSAISKGTTKPQRLSLIGSQVFRLADWIYQVGISSAVERFCNAIETKIQELPDELSEESSNNLLFQGSMILGLAKDQGTCGKVLKLLSVLGNSTPLLGVRILPFLLYLLQQRVEGQDEEERKFALLQALPEIARHPIVARKVGVVLASFTDPQIPTEMRATALRLCSRLYKVNSRTFPRLKQMIQQGAEKLSNEEEKDNNAELRLARCACILDVVEKDPENATEFVAILQTYLSDQVAGVVGMVLNCLAGLCRAECLDFQAAFKVIMGGGKKGTPSKVSAKVLEQSVLVRTCLATFCGSVQIEEPDDDDDDTQQEISPKLNADVPALLQTLGNFCADSAIEVQAAAFQSLSLCAGPILSDLDEDISERKSWMQDQLAAGMLSLKHHDYPEPLLSAVMAFAKALLYHESQDSSTWSQSRYRDITGSVISTQKGGEQSTASSKSVKLLPTHMQLVAKYQENPGFGGLAGALLMSCEDLNSAKRMKASQRTKLLFSGLLDYLTDEDYGGNCPFQRALAPLGYLHYMDQLLAAATKAERQAGKGELQACMDATEKVYDRLIQTSGSEMALGAFANAVASTPSGARQVTLIVDHLQKLLLGQTDQIAMRSTILPIALSLAARCLSVEKHQLVKDIRTILSDGLSSSLQCDNFSYALSLGLLSSWAPNTTDALWLVRSNVLVLGKSLLSALSGCEGLSGILEACLSDSYNGSVVVWAQLVQDSNIEDLTLNCMEVSFFGICLGLSQVLPLLVDSGMEAQLHQVFHILRALVEKGAPNTIYIALTSCVGPLMEAKLLHSGDINKMFRKLTQQMEAPEPPPATSMALASLVAGVQGRMMLPPGFSEQALSKMTSQIANEDQHQDVRISAMVGALNMVGSGVLIPPYTANLGRLVCPPKVLQHLKALVDAMWQTTETLTLRVRACAYRALGILAALRSSRLANPKGKGVPGKALLHKQMALDPSDYVLPREGTSMRTVLQDLITALSSDSGSGGTVSKLVTFLLGALTPVKLYTPHAQVTTLLTNIVLLGTPGVIQACLKFAVVQRRDRIAYFSWIVETFCGHSFSKNDMSVQKLILQHVGPIMAYISPGMAKDILENIWGVVMPADQDLFCNEGGGSVQLASLFMEGLSQILLGVVEGETVHPITVEAIKNFMKKTAAPRLLDLPFHVASFNECQYNALIWTNVTACLQVLDDELIKAIIIPNEYVTDPNNAQIPGYGLIILTSKLIDAGKLAPGTLDWVRIKFLQNPCRLSFMDALYLCLALPRDNQSFQHAWILGFMDFLQLLQDEEKLRCAVYFAVLTSVWSSSDVALTNDSFFGLDSLIEMLTHTMPDCLQESYFQKMAKSTDSAQLEIFQSKIAGKIAKLSDKNKTSNGTKKIGEDIFQSLFCESVRNIATS